MPPRPSRQSRRSQRIKKSKTKTKSRSRSRGLKSRGLKSRGLRSRHSRISGGCWLSDLFKGKNSSSNSKSKSKTQNNNNNNTNQIKRVLDDPSWPEEQNTTLIQPMMNKPNWMKNLNAKKRAANERIYNKLPEAENTSQIDAMMRTMTMNKPNWMKKPNEPPRSLTFRPQAIKRNYNQQQMKPRNLNYLNVSSGRSQIF